MDIDQQQQQPADEAAPDPARRNFLRGAPLGVLAVVAGSAAAAEPAPVAAPAEPPAPAAGGYHETEHIRTYYRTARYW